MSQCCIDTCGIYKDVIACNGSQCICRTNELGCELEGGIWVSPKCFTTIGLVALIIALVVIVVLISLCVYKCCCRTRKPIGQVVYFTDPEQQQVKV